VILLESKALVGDGSLVVGSIGVAAGIMANALPLVIGFLTVAILIVRLALLIRQWVRG
jgi:hypothetical protein